MSNGTYRAWRFLHPDIDATEAAAGLQISPQGSISLVSGSAAVRQSILLLISTIPGERVKRPDYGCHLHRLIFAANNDTTAGLAIHYVRQAIERWEPRVQILNLDAGPHPDQPEILEITLEFRVRPGGAVEHLGVSLDLAG
jgi:uncharacterized protein